MIELIATAESLDQGKALIDAGVQKVIVGEARYGLRLPGYLSLDDLQELVVYAHENNKEVVVAANAILHNDKINTARDYLAKVKASGADLLLVGDTGLIQILKEEEYKMPYIYDASVLVTSAGQVNFWSKYGAVAAKVANEVPLVELQEMADQTEIPLMQQVYGASCIHQSGRMLLDNYFSYVGKATEEVDDHQLFLSQPDKEETHFSIYQDDHGTHVFANNDIDLMPYLDDLAKLGINIWYLDGIYAPGEDFVDIAMCFAQAKDLIESGLWSDEKAQSFDAQVQDLHPDNREVSTGFFLYEKDTVK